jgi:HD-like signal output (HDOD) protein/CheY-like chemotaxis protein
MKQILFVDDEPMILEGLQRTLANMRHEWEMRFAASGEEALQMLEECPADAVVTDMRMPRMNGAQLLQEVMRRNPKTIRLILSGFSDAEVIMRCVGGTHQFISKPCDGDTLRRVVRRALDMDAWVNNEDLKALVSRLPSLPSLPSLYFEILRELESPSGSLDRMGEIIGRDAAMTAKILHLVNSAFFGLQRELSDPTEAVMQLGLETIRSLVLGIHVFSEMKTTGKAAMLSQELWNHCLATAIRAKSIAKTERLDRELVETSFTAGLLHDVGRLVLLANLPGECLEAWRRAEEEHLPLVETERSVFGADHGAVGGYLLGLWGLPARLVEACVYHHFPAQCPNREISPLSIVHVANFLVHDSPDAGNFVLMPRLDEHYLAELGIWEHVKPWCRLPKKAA